MSVLRVDPATATMISLIGSLADNKSALGRRYGEWAVSAPTIESAVAAAAMAQDELGHARSTYPVLAKLGVERSDSGLETGHPLFVISSELPDWASFIAANLVVDGVLTTFVAGARDSSIEPLAQRARKILQEEGAHKVHAEAWARRICRAGGPDLELLVVRIEEMWSSAARWPGPDSRPRIPGGDGGGDGRFGSGGDPAAGARLAWTAGRRRVAGRAGRFLGLGRAVPPMRCPFCDSEDVEVVAPWGGQMITSQVRCRACNTYFEAIREEFEGTRGENPSWTTSSADDR